VSVNEDAIPYDSRLLRWKRRHEENVALDKQNARIARETNTSLPASPAAPTATAHTWSPEDLRGIPAIGRSVRGAINTSVPHIDGLRD
jgi:hypothetical protein